MPSASRVKGDLKEYGYISFDMVDSHRSAGIYLHCSEDWTVDGRPGLGLSIQGSGKPEK